MNGVIAVRSLLVADTGVTSLVPVVRIAAGMLPQGTDLPAISLMSVSSVDRNVPAPGAKRRVTERVQVTVLARTYPEVKAIIAAVRQAVAPDKKTPSHSLMYGADASIAGELAQLDGIHRHAPFHHHIGCGNPVAGFPNLHHHRSALGGKP